MSVGESETSPLLRVFACVGALFVFEQGFNDLLSFGGGTLSGVDEQDMARPSTNTLNSGLKASKPH